MYIGVTYSGGKQPIAFAGLDGRQKVVALGKGKLWDAVAYCSGPAEAVIFCGMPICRPENGDCRPAETALEQRGLPTFRTSTDPQSHHPAAGFGIHFAADMASIDYGATEGEEITRLLLEGNAAAAYQNLLGMRPFDAHTLEGRLQRQLILFERGLPIPDPMDFFEEVTRHKLLHGVLPTKDVYSSAELDALVLAHTAWLYVHERQQLLTLGEPGDGQIFLPQPQ